MADVGREPSHAEPRRRLLSKGPGAPAGPLGGGGVVGRRQVGQTYAKSIQLRNSLNEHFEEAGIVG